jgi:hypothetical protein
VSESIPPVAEAAPPWDPAVHAADLLAWDPPPAPPAPSGPQWDLPEEDWWFRTQRPPRDRWWRDELVARLMATELPERLVAVYVVLDAFTTPGRRDAWPSIETIAARTGRSPRTVNRALDKLIQRGWIERHPGEGRKGPTGWTTTRYVIADPPPPPSRE